MSPSSNFDGANSPDGFAGPCAPRPSCRSSRSADGRRVLDAAFVPQFIQATIDLERRTHPDVAFKRLAVVADLFDDANGPIFRQSELLAEIALGSDKALDLRIVRFQRLVDILLGDV